MINDFFNIDVDNTPFFYYQDKVITRKNFKEMVGVFSSAISKYDLKDEYIYLNISNSLDFYISLLSLWKLNKKIVFPTKANLESKKTPLYCKYVLSVHDNQLNIDVNDNFVKLLQEGDTILFSSGSTGEPKGIVHNKEHFLINALNTLKLLNISHAVSVTYLSPYLVSALSHFLVHWYSKSTIIFDDYKNINNLKKYKKISNNLNIVGSPIHIISSIKHVKEAKIKPDFFFSSGDVIHDTVIHDVLNSFSNVTFFKVYGLAEIAGRLFINKIVKKDEIQDIGRHIEGTNVEYVKDEVVISSENLFLGYIKKNKYFKTSDIFCTGDLVSHEKGFIILKGRKNDEIKIAGNKVSIKYLENIISNVLKPYDIDLIVVVATSHKVFGYILSLVLDNASITKEDIVKSLKMELKSYQMPHQYFFIQINEVPFTQTMKVDRKKLVHMIHENKINSIA
jgi:acyl-CoA synthetase (AMP-forming)/AMP-acid ligase II